MDEKECEFYDAGIYKTGWCNCSSMNLDSKCENNTNCYYKQLRTATEQLSIAKEALESSIDKMVNCQTDGCIDKNIACEDCYIAILQQALAKIEEVRC